MLYSDYSWSKKVDFNSPHNRITVTLYVLVLKNFQLLFGSLGSWLEVLWIFDNLVGFSFVCVFLVKPHQFCDLKWFLLLILKLLDRELGIVDLLISTPHREPQIFHALEIISHENPCFHIETWLGWQEGIMRKGIDWGIEIIGDFLGLLILIFLFLVVSK